MVYINVKKWEHYNKAFKNWDCPYGKYIGSKAAYEKAMHDEGMISEDQAAKMGYQDAPARKDYKVKKDTLALLESVKATKDSKGVVHPSERAKLRLLQKRKEAKYNNSVCPSHYQTKGGFSE